MKLQTRFTFDRVQFDKDTDAHLVVSLTAPAQTAEQKRPPVCIIPVIDISGSMQGQKLAYAKQSAMKLVEQLQPGDYAGLVSFSSSARVEFFPVEMTQARKDELKVKIGQLHTEGSTNLCDGIMKALDAAKRLDLPESTITRVILLTDGQPTHGIAKTGPELRTLLAKTRDHVSLSAFGYGAGADQALLADVATEGKGNYAFIENPDNALATFGKELGGLLSTYAQNLVIEVRPSSGHTVGEVVSDLDVDEEVDGEIAIKVPAILAEETNNIVLAVKLTAQKSAGPRAVNAFDVRVRYETLGDDGIPVTKTEEAKAKVQFVRADDAQKTPSKEVDDIVARAQLVKVQVAAEQAAQNGDFKTSGALFNDFAQQLAARGHDGLVGVTRHLNDKYVDVRSYSASAGNRVGLRAAMTRGVGASGTSAEDQAALLSAGYVMSNSTQESYSTAFSQPQAAPADPDPAAPVVDLGALWGGASVAAPDLSGSLGTSSILVGTGVSGVSNQVEVPSTPQQASPSKPTKKVAKAKSKRW